MTFERMSNAWGTAAAAAVLLACSWSCDESLPVYVPPSNVLKMTISRVEQLNDRVAPPGKQSVRIDLTGQNVFTDVFYDSVDIQGQIYVYWERKPDRFRTLYLTKANFVDKSLLTSGKMLLQPGQKFTVETYWNMKSDDSLYLVNEMNFANLRTRVCAFNIACADPEAFVAEASLKVYAKIGYVSAPASEFTFTGRIYILPPP